MAEAQDGQERTEQATPKRREEARKKGDVARSRDLCTTVALMAAATSFWVFGGAAGDGLSRVMARFLGLEREVIFNPGILPGLLIEAMIQMLRIMGPFFAVALVAALLSPGLVGGWIFSTELLCFKWERLNPMQGFRRILGPKGAVEMGKTLIKLILVAMAAVLVIRIEMPTLLGLGNGSLEGDLAAAFQVMGRTFLWLCAATLLAGALDAPLQLWEHSKRLHMSRQEIREEHKDTEGKPEVRSRIRRLQQELATRRMMQEVPKADVIVTNPTRYAVAFRYDQKMMPAPKVVAKGVDEIAAKIRDVAAEHRVPILTAPPLARAIYHSTKLNQEIPAGLYVAVAQVLAYVFQLRSRKNGDKTPPVPKDLPIPEEFKRDL